jgi:hypothetical protein
MLMKRANKFFLTLAAVLSLFVSAVSACACSHHQPEQEAEKASCHSAAHEQPAAEAAESPALPENFGVGCNCFVKTPSPAITAKSEVKKASIVDSSAAMTEFGPVVPVEFSVLTRNAGPRTRTAQFAGRDLTAGPSRAPPRL